MVTSIAVNEPASGQVMRLRLRVVFHASRTVRGVRSVICDLSCVDFR